MLTPRFPTYSTSIDLITNIYGLTYCVHEPFYVSQGNVELDAVRPVMPHSVVVSKACNDKQIGLLA